MKSQKTCDFVARSESIPPYPTPPKNQKSVLHLPLTRRHYRLRKGASRTSHKIAMLLDYYKIVTERSCYVM